MRLDGRDGAAVKGRQDSGDCFGLLWDGARALAISEAAHPVSRLSLTLAVDILCWQEHSQSFVGREFIYLYNDSRDLCAERHTQLPHP